MIRIKSSNSLKNDEFNINPAQNFYNDPITKYFKSNQKPQSSFLYNKQRPQNMYQKNTKNVQINEKQIINGSESNHLSSISESEYSYESKSKDLYSSKKRSLASNENLDKKSINIITQITPNLTNNDPTENRRKLFIKQKSLNVLSAKKRKKNSDFNIYNDTTVTSNNRTSLKNMFKMSLSPIFKSRMGTSVKENNVLTRVKTRKRRSTDFEGKDIMYKSLIHNSILSFNKEYPEYFKIIFRIKIFDIIIACLSIISIFLAFEDLRLYNTKSFDYFHLEYPNNPIIKDKNFDILKILMKRKISGSENTLRYLNGCVSILSTILLVIRYNKKNEVYNKIKKKHLSSVLSAKKLIDEQNLLYVFGANEELKILIIKIIILILFYPPYINKSIIAENNKNCFYMYSLNSLFVFINCIKIYPILDSFFEYSMYNSFSSKKICFARSLKVDRKFIIKSTFNRYPVLLSIFFYLIFLIVTAGLIYGYESNVIDIKNSENNSITGFTFFIDDLWLVSSMQILRVYGEMSPVTYLGKYTLFVGGLGGFMSLCFIVYYLNKLTEFNAEENRAYSTVLAVHNNENKENKAANVILFFLFTKKSYVDFKNRVVKEIDNVNDENDKKILIKNYKNQLICMKFFVFVKLYTSAKNFKNKYKLFKKSSINDLLRTYQNILRDYIINIDHRLDGLVDIDEKMNKLKAKKNLILDNVSKLDNRNIILIEYLLKINNQLVLQKKLKLKKFSRQSLQIRLITQKIRLSQVTNLRNNKVSLPNIQLVNNNNSDSILKSIIDYFHNDLDEINFIKNKHNVKTQISRKKKEFTTFITKKRVGKSCDHKRLLNRTLINENIKFEMDSFFQNENRVKPKCKRSSVIKRKVKFDLDKKGSEK